MLLDMVIFIAILLLLAYCNRCCKCYSINLCNHNRQSRRAPARAISVSAPVATVIASSSTTSARGIGPEILTSLPEFTYPSVAPTERLICAVCLSEFTGGEKGRLLPRCCHSFHAECVDEWFNGHSTCPLCRATVERVASDWVI